MAGPHDTLVRYTFGNVEHARGLLQSIVPAGIVGAINWTTLKAVDGTFSDDQQTDLLFTVLRDPAQLDGYIARMFDAASIDDAVP